MRGRKREVTLEVDPQNKIIVKKDSGMDVILMYEETGAIEVLNPRQQLILLKDKQGAVRVKEAPPKTKMSVIKTAMPSSDSAPEAEPEEGGDDSEA